MAEDFGGVFPEDDYKFPETPVPDEDVAFPAGQYIGILGRITPFFAGKDGKRAIPGDTEARLFNSTQEIWVFEAQEDKPNGGGKVFAKRIAIDEGVIKFPKGTTRGVKILESFPMPLNPLYEKLAWKARAFYKSFPNVIIGEKGAKRIVWEAAKALAGHMIFFEIAYAESKGKRYRNVNNVEFLPDKKIDIENLAKIEAAYNELRQKEKDDQNTKQGGPAGASAVDAVFSKEDLPF